MGTLDSAVGSGSLAESTSLNIEVRSSDASNATVCIIMWIISKESATFYPYQWSLLHYT